LSSSLSSSTRLGWPAICQILQQVEDQCIWVETGVPPQGYEDEHKKLEVKYDFYGKPDYEEAIWLIHGGHKAPSCDHFEVEIPTAFGKNRLLGHIWAACQCELLTYRRLGEEDPWMSKRIDVGTLAKSLELGSAQEIPYVKEGRLKEYCVCGWFKGREGRCRPRRRLL
jgi:hypothetical protein